MAIPVAFNFYCMSKNKRIIIIDDDANALYGLLAKLRIEGFEAVADEGYDKTEVLEKIKFFKPNYIILDVALVKLNGFKMLAEIKANSATSKIPIFVFTDLSDSDSRKKSLGLGANFYLIKTELNLDEFVVKFKKIINNKEKINENF